MITVPPHVALAVMFEHWTPKGDCKVTGNKERYKKMNWTKNKLTKKLKSSSKSYKKYCPLPYSLPLGASANLAARQEVPSCVGWTGGTGWTGWMVIKSVLYFFSFEDILTTKHIYTYIYKSCPHKFLVGFKFWSSWGFE